MFLQNTRLRINIPLSSGKRIKQFNIKIFSNSCIKYKNIVITGETLR